MFSILFLVILLIFLLIFSFNEIMKVSLNTLFFNLKSKYFVISIVLLNFIDYIDINYTDINYTDINYIERK